MTGGLPTPSGSDVWGAQLNAAIKALTNAADLPPASANAKDDEFDGASSATWTATPTAATAWALANNKLYIRSNGNGTPFPVVGKYQSVPSYPFTVETKMSATNVFYANSFAGLFYAPASPSASSPIGVLASVGGYSPAAWVAVPSNTQRLRYSAFNGNTFVSAATEASFAGRPTFPRYFRLVFTSATSVASYVSLDGVNWRTVETGLNPGFTPGVIGLGVCENNASTNAVDTEATFDYFRVS